MASVHLQASSKAAWAFCGRSPAAAEKSLGAMILPTIDGVPPLHQIVGNISTRRRITRKSLRSDRRPVSLCEPLCAFARSDRNRPRSGLKGRFAPLSEGLRGTKGAAGESEWVVTTHSRSQTPAVRTFSEFHFWVMTRLQKRFLGCKIKNP